MLRHILLSAFLLAALVQASSVVVASKQQQIDLVGKVDCNECKEIISIVYGVAENRIALNTTVTVLEDICRAKFATNQSRLDDCLLLVRLGGDLVPLLFDGMRDLAWDIPLTFCADLVKACFEPCCNATTGIGPQEVYINFADSKDLSQYRVTWITLNETTNGRVEWWTTSSPSAVTTAASTSRTYTVGGWIGVIHTAVMTGLLPATTYGYRVGESVYGFSANLSFTTLPSIIGVPSRPLRIVQIADMGYASFSTATVDRIESLVNAGEVDFIIHNGDVSYADADEQHWDDYFRKIQPFASKVPYMTTPGNHELWWNFTAYQARCGMSMPTAGPNALSGAMYYPLTVGPHEFVFMNSETWIDTGDLDAAQIAWFLNYTSSIDRSTNPLLTVTHHRPLYCCECRDILSDILRSQGEPAFYQAKVDIHFSGHQHNYQRTYPVYKSEVVNTTFDNPMAPVYVLNGAAGNREGQMGFHKNEAYLVNGSSAYGLSYVTYVADEQTRVATINFQFINSVTGNVDDSFVLTKNY